ncbi:MAG: cysteine--tRNA ligase [Desulfobacteraceae bacterium]|nr:MAG: cysteine--tRNA ligase [Desulfobacteraceae bacterium]
MLYLFNSMTLQKDPFIAHDGPVGVYVCGLTPFDAASLGHAFTYVHFDVLVRYLRHLGHRVVYVQNLTDIDDRIFEKADAQNADWREISDQNTYRFLSDMHWLGNLAPTIFPRVTDLIPAMIWHIEKLLEGRWAYKKNGHVYFDVASYSPFGRLSRLPRDQWLPAANRKGNHPDDPRKLNPLDFVLWQSGRTGEPVWDSPWGKGRPGWHVECAAMAMKFLGPTVDINGGGIDLIFPHHECSVAQSECITGKTFSRYWVHTGPVVLPKHSLGGGSQDSIRLQDLRHMGGNVLRISILDHHYAQQWIFDPRDLRMAKETDELFRQAWLRPDGRGRAIDPLPFEKVFYAAMDDNLNTPQALGHLRQIAIEIMRDSTRNAAGAKSFLGQALRILGVQADPSAA